MLDPVLGNGAVSSTPRAEPHGGVDEARDTLQVVTVDDPPARDRSDSPSTRGGSRHFVWLLAAHAPLVTALLSLAVALIGFRGGDYPAQEYRAFMFGAHGFLIWDVNWYGGHALIGYSVLFPAVGWMVGTVPATAIACTTSTLLFGRLVGPANNWAAVVARLWFAVFVVGDLIVGRAPFAFAVTAALAAILLVRAERPRLGGLAAVVASLFSPLGAAFLLLIALAWAPSLGWRRAAPFAGAFVGLAIAAVAGDGGMFPFPWPTFVGQLAIVAIGLAVAPHSERTVRRALWLYGISCVVLFFVPTPVGGNIARLAGMMIGPAAALILVRAKRTRALLVLTLPLVIFQLIPIVAAVASAAGDPSTKRQYYQGMLQFLGNHEQPLGRVEVPFTRDHWEATYVAEKEPIARGWDRQIDISRNAILYGPLTADTYRTWLYDNAVRYVALPDVPLDQGGKAEQALLRHPPSWLKPVYVDTQWRIWEVVGPAPLASGAAHMTTLTASGFTLSSANTGVTFVRLRWSQYWHVDAGAACVGPAGGGWTTVITFATGDTKISARALLNKDTCTTDQLAAAGLGPHGAPEPQP